MAKVGRLFGREKGTELDLAGVVLDVTFQLAGIDPSDKVLHVPRDKESRIGDDIWANADVALFDVLNSLGGWENQRRFSAGGCVGWCWHACMRSRGMMGMYHFHRLSHLEPTGNHGQSTTTKGADRHFRLNVAHLAPMRFLRPPRTIENPYVVELVQ